jgi:hypothetical protein
MRNIDDMRQELIHRFRNGFFNVSFSSEMLRNDEFKIQMVDELKADLAESKKYVGEIFDEHCRDPSPRPGANDFEIILM